MIRLIGIFIGLGFAVMALWAFGSGASAVIGQGYLVEATAEHSRGKLFDRSVAIEQARGGHGSDPGNARIAIGRIAD